MTKGERYLICKNLNIDSVKQTKLLQQLEEHCKPKMIANTLDKSQVHSLIRNDIPYYFSNKLEEIKDLVKDMTTLKYYQLHQKRLLD